MIDEKRKRRTQHRAVILQVIQEASGPLLAAEIGRRARARVPGTGRATVYRALKDLQQRALVQAVNLPSGERRYGVAYAHHHDRFQCRACLQLFDLTECPLSLPPGTKLPGGFVVEDHETTIYGTCANCSAQSQPPLTT